MSAAPRPVWLTPKQAEAYCQSDIATLRRAVRRGALQAFRVNGSTRIRYRAADLDRWLESNPIGTNGA